MKTWENEKDPKVDPKVDALCIEHRKKKGAYIVKFNENSIGSHELYWTCNWCSCRVTCPVPAERDKIYPPEVKGQSGVEGGIIAPAQGTPRKKTAEIYGDIEIDEIKDDKPAKEKKISREIEDFLWMQSRVIDKLNRHPELWCILDRMFADDIIQKLCGKSVSELVPAHYGGKMDTKVSKTTKKMFETLEKQFAEEDEKTGKKAPDFEGQIGGQIGVQAINDMLSPWGEWGGAKVEWIDRKSQRKTIKCEKCGKDFAEVCRPCGDRLCDKCYADWAKKKEWRKHDEQKKAD